LRKTPVFAKNVDFRKKCYKYFSQKRHFCKNGNF
jgi:hypothetical protein